MEVYTKVGTVNTFSSVCTINFKYVTESAKRCSNGEVWFPGQLYLNRFGNIKRSPNRYNIACKVALMLVAHMYSNYTLTFNLISHQIVAIFLPCALGWSPVINYNIFPTIFKKNARIQCGFNLRRRAWYSWTSIIQMITEIALGIPIMVRSILSDLYLR